tara:strand:- start:87 stop:683 length:597 start_codon:yes stop_codon:yes gene_type:complete
MNKDKIIYYSKYCKNCDKIIQILSRSTVKNYMHFIPIDKRIINDGKVTILLDSGEKVILPQNITKVPAMLLLHSGNRILFGDEILHFFRDDFDKERKKSTNNNGEPLAYSFTGEMGTSMSDNYSYLDQTSDELGVKGQGGLRQMHSFVTLEDKIMIDTPPEDYVKEKLDENAIKQYQESRNSVVQQPKIPQNQDFSLK